MVVCLQHCKIKELRRDGSFTTIQPICDSPNAHIYFVSRALASFSHVLLPLKFFVQLFHLNCSSYYEALKACWSFLFFFFSVHIFHMQLFKTLATLAPLCVADRGLFRSFFLSILSLKKIQFLFHQNKE